MARRSKQETRSKPDRRQPDRRGPYRTPLVLACLAAVAIAIGAASFDRLPSPIGDNAEFAILASSLATGHGFRYLNHPDLLPATKYPPGFPLFLAMWIPLFGSSMVVMKVVVLACYVLLVPLTYLLARRFLGQAESVIAALMIATSAGVPGLAAGVVPYSHEVLSDVPYALFSLAALLLIGGASKTRGLLAGLALVVWAYAVRSAGVSLVVAAALYLMLRSRRREALLLLGSFAVFSCIWMLRNYLVGGEGSRYFDVLAAKNPYDPSLGTVGVVDVLSRIVVNFLAYVGGFLQENILPAVVGASSRPLYVWPVSLILMAVMIVGGWRLRRKALLLNLYLAAYALVYLLWPETWRSGRFMLPVAPIAAVYFASGIVHILGHLRLKRTAALAVLAAVAATNLYSLPQYAARERGYTVGWANYLSTAIWARENTEPDALFLCRSAYLYYVFSGRKTIGYPFTRDADEMRAHLAKWHPDYIVIDNELGFPQTQIYLLPVLVSMEDQLKSVFATPEPINAVFRFTPAGTGGAR